jgi:hypothetical protein
MVTGPSEEHLGRADLQQVFTSKYQWDQQAYDVKAARPADNFLPSIT